MGSLISEIPVLKNLFSSTTGRLPRHLEVKYVIQMFCHEIMDTSKIRMFCFSFCSIAVYDCGKNEAFWPPGKLKIKYSWHTHNYRPGNFCSGKLRKILFFGQIRTLINKILKCCWNLCLRNVPGTSTRPEPLTLIISRTVEVPQVDNTFCQLCSLLIVLNVPLILLYERDWMVDLDLSLLYLLSYCLLYFHVISIFAFASLI